MSGNTEVAFREVMELVDGEEGANENGVVQVLGGLVLQGLGRSEEALGLLGGHQGNLEA